MQNAYNIFDITVNKAVYRVIVWRCCLIGTHCMIVHVVIILILLPYSPNVSQYESY